MRQHLLIAVRTGELQYFRIHVTHLIHFCPGTAGDNHLTVFIQRFASDFPRCLDGAVDKSAGVDDDDFSIVIARLSIIAFATQFGEDAPGVGKVFVVSDRALFPVPHSHGAEFYLCSREKCRAICAGLAPCKGVKKPVKAGLLTGWKSTGGRRGKIPVTSDAVKRNSAFNR